MSKPSSTPTALRVSQMAENLVGSEIIKLAGEIKAKIAAGEKIYNFTIGDFDPSVFGIPDALLTAILEAYKAGHTNYPAGNGMPQLRSAVADYISKRQKLDYSPEEFLISGGARPLIYATYQALVDPGDKVIFPVPSWNNNHYTHLSHANAVFLPTTPEQNFMPLAEDIAPHVSGATLIAVCSPLNPTGTVFSEEQLRGLCELVLAENSKRAADEKPLFLLFDQIYWQLTFGDTKHVDPVSLYPEMRDYTIYIDGLSKAYAATGVRVGWAFGPQKVINKMKAILGHVGAWSPKAEQMASAEFLQMDSAIDAYLDKFKSRISARLNAFYQGFTTLKNDGHPVEAITPQAAMYLTVRFDLIGKKTAEGKVLEKTEDVTAYLLEEAKLGIVPFYAFGAERNSPWYRLSVGTSKSEEIPAVFAMLNKALTKLKG